MIVFFITIKNLDINFYLAGVASVCFQQLGTKGGPVYRFSLFSLNITLMKNFLSNEFMDRIILLRILGYVEPRTLAEPCQLLPTLKIKKGKKSNVQFADKINYQKRFYRVTFLLNYSLNPIIWLYWVFA